MVMIKWLRLVVTGRNEAKLNGGRVCSKFVVEIEKKLTDYLITEFKYYSSIKKDSLLDSWICN